MDFVFFSNASWIDRNMCYRGWQIRISHFVSGWDYESPTLDQGFADIRVNINLLIYSDWVKSDSAFRKMDFKIQVWDSNICEP